MGIFLPPYRETAYTDPAPLEHTRMRAWHECDKLVTWSKPNSIWFAAIWSSRCTVRYPGWCSVRAFSLTDRLGPGGLAMSQCGWHWLWGTPEPSVDGSVSMVIGQFELDPRVVLSCVEGSLLTAVFFSVFCGAAARRCASQRKRSKKT